MKRFTDVERRDCIKRATRFKKMKTQFLWRQTATAGGGGGMRLNGTRFSTGCVFAADVGWSSLCTGAPSRGRNQTDFIPKARNPITQTSSISLTVRVPSVSYVGYVARLHFPEKIVFLGWSSRVKSIRRLWQPWNRCRRVARVRTRGLKKEISLGVSFIYRQQSRSMPLFETQRVVFETGTAKQYQGLVFN